MIRTAVVLLLVVLSSGCSTPKFSIADPPLQVNGDSAGRKVASEIPMGSLMERFDMVGRDFLRPGRALGKVRSPQLAPGIARGLELAST